MADLHSDRTSHPKPTSDRPSLVYLDARADARNASRDALEAGIELFESFVNDPECSDVERFIASERLRTFAGERDRRDRVERLATDTATRHDRDYQAWTAVREVVKERVEVPSVLQFVGLDLRQEGTSRGRTEWSSACPVCGTGTDRLRCWSGPRGTVWCRQCGWKTDVIGAASLLLGTGYRDTLRLLVDHAGLGVKR